MVRIIAAHLRKSGKGEFMSLELQSGLELVQSQNTGRFYATVRKCFLGTTFDAATANSFIGESLPGTLVRVSCEPYTYTSPGTKEEITLSHTYSYQPPEEKPAGIEADYYVNRELELLK
jgi:hypothetical protein